jgi:uncharacterized protein YndB with AHSA1/START domain
LSDGEEFAEVGSVVVDGEEATLVFRRRLPRTPEEVKAITEPSQLSAWYMTRAV